jgi:hypothetical protein
MPSRMRGKIIAVLYINKMSGENIIQYNPTIAIKHLTCKQFVPMNIRNLKRVDILSIQDRI